MPATMAKREGDSGKAKKPRRAGVPLHAWIDEAIMSAMDSYLKATEPRVSKTAAIEVALKDFLRGKGFWPPKE